MLHNKLPNEENVINNGANQEKFEGKTFSLNVLSLNLYFKVTLKGHSLSRSRNQGESGAGV